MLELKINEAPVLKINQMNCDNQLDKKLEKYELTRLINKHSANIVIGRQGSGKTSLLYSLLMNKKLLQGVYHNIFVFIPPSSLASFGESCLYNTLDEDKIYHTLTTENLAYVISYIESEPENTHLIIIDDMSSSLKDKLIQKQLERCIANMRHMKLSIYFICQRWRSLPKGLRSIMSNLFIFNVSKVTLEEIFEELISIDKKYIQEIKNLMLKEKYSFLFYNINSSRLFLNFNEILIPN